MTLIPHIKSARGLLASVILTQSIFIAAGFLIALGLVHHATASSLKQWAFHNNTLTVDRLSSEIESLHLRDVQYGSEGWDAIQTKIEQLDLPDGAFACLLDEQGNILCHPDLRKQPNLRRVKLGSKILHGANSENREILNQGDGVSTGRLSFINGVHYVATKPIKELGIRLVVHQPESGLAAASAPARRLVIVAMTGSGLLVIGLTALSVTLISRKHRSTIKKINAGLEEEIAWRAADASRTRDGLIFGLAKLADCRDSDTGQHLDRICAYSVLLARRLQQQRLFDITEESIERLRMAASLHDIGKVGIPDAILLKPGKLTFDERRIMQRHTTIAGDMLLELRRRLGNEELLTTACEVALAHHERWDGAGYPYGLKGEMIPVAARIVAVADVYDALRSDRVYKKALTHEEAHQIILDGKGTHFDPVIVDAFIDVAGDFALMRDRLDRSDAPKPPTHQRTLKAA